MYDVAALGELLIDFTPYGVSQAGNNLFERNPGGAPANVLVALAKLKKKTAFLGMVGKDEFGVFLKETLNSNNVDTSGLVLNENVNTTLAFIHLKENGDRNFSFYRNPGADMKLTVEEVNYEVIANSKIFHFGSLSLTDEPVRSATLEALKFAREKGLIISYDPNLRPPLWKSMEFAKEMICLGLEYADIIKVSEEELEFITGIKDYEKGTEVLFHEGIKVIFVTLGEKGCFYRYKGGTGYIEAFKVNAIDTTGAGDGFLGAVLSQLADKSIDEINDMNKEELEAIIIFGNALGALVTTKKGAIPAMPTEEEVNEFVKSSLY